jgi:hypothetical protein
MRLIYSISRVTLTQGVTRRYGLSCLTNCAPRFMSPNAGQGGGCRVSAKRNCCAHHVTWSPNKLWRSNSIFNLCSDLIQIPDVLILDVLSVGVVLGVLVAEDGLKAVPVLGTVDVRQVQEGVLVRTEEMQHLRHTEQVQLCPLKHGIIKINLGTES